MEIIFLKSNAEGTKPKTNLDSQSNESHTDEYGDPKLDWINRAPHSLYNDEQCAENDVYS